MCSARNFNTALPGTQVFILRSQIRGSECLVGNNVTQKGSNFAALVNKIQRHQSSQGSKQDLAIRSTAREPYDHGDSS